MPASERILEASFIAGRDGGKHDAHHREACRIHLKTAWGKGGYTRTRWEDIITQQTRVGDSDTIGSTIETIIWRDRGSDHVDVGEKAIVSGRICSVVRERNVEA